MAFTDRSELFVSIHENGINQALRHIMRQRPSRFNYGTELVNQNPELLCSKIEVAPAVIAKGNPIITVHDPLPIFGSDPPLGVNFCVQLTGFQIDFSPGNVFPLPPEVNPLGAQRFALRAQVCAGIGCPNDDTLGQFERMVTRQLDRRQKEQEAQAYLSEREKHATGREIAKPQVREPAIPIPSRQLTCFCLEFFVVGHVDVMGGSPNQILVPRFDGFEIVDIHPEPMENAIECYVKMLVRLVLLPRARLSLYKLFAVGDMFTLALLATPTSSALPHNPAVEDDQAKVFIDLSTGPPPPPSPPSPPTPPGPPGPTRDINWSPTGPPGPGGPSHLIAAASEGAVNELFVALRDSFKKTATKSVNFGPFVAGYDIEVVLENGSIDLQSDGRIKLKELDVKFNKLKFILGFDIDEICVGGQCVIPTPWGCVRLPKICAFSGNPDIGLSLDLAPYARLEFSLLFQLLVRYGIENGRPAGLLDVDAKAMGIPNLWGIFLHAITTNVDLFDISDIVGDLLENAIESAINNLLPGPQWAKDLVMGILGPIIDLIRDILDAPDDLKEWLSDLLGVSLGLLDFIATLLINHYAGDKPLAKLEDPFQVADADGILIPIMIPIRDLSVAVDDKEMVVKASVGA